MNVAIDEPELDIVSAVYDPATLTVVLKLSRAPYPEELEELQLMCGQVNAAKSMRHSDPH